MSMIIWLRLRLRRAIGMTAQPLRKYPCRLAGYGSDRFLTALFAFTACRSFDPKQTRYEWHVSHHTSRVKNTYGSCSI